MILLRAAYSLFACVGLQHLGGDWMAAFSLIQVAGRRILIQARRCIGESACDWMPASILGQAPEMHSMLLSLARAVVQEACHHGLVCLL